MGLAFGSLLEGSGGEQDPGGCSGDAGPHGDGLQQTGAKEPARVASEVEERGVSEPLANRLGLRLGNHRAGEASPLDRRVDRPDDGLEQLRVGIVVGDRIAESVERR